MNTMAKESGFCHIKNISGYSTLYCLKFQNHELADQKLQNHEFISSIFFFCVKKFISALILYIIYL